MPGFVVSGPLDKMSAMNVEPINLISAFTDLMKRGGPIMWPLLVLSIGGLTLILERTWFWLATNSSRRTERIRRLAFHLRHGQIDQINALLAVEHSVYGNVVRQLMMEGASEATAIDAVERQRPRLDRFMPTISTIITAAPMLGILGTVLGIIASFHALSGDQLAIDPKLVGAGIAEALITTVGGLVVALMVVFPYNLFRAQADRTLTRMETLIAAARQGLSPTGTQAPDKPQPTNDDQANTNDDA